MAGPCSLHMGYAQAGCRLCSLTREEVFGPDWEKQLDLAKSGGTIKCTHCGFDGIFKATTKVDGGNMCPRCGKIF
jgi:DNA-directed RNA polymerase subunit RPC12/RpoP